MNLIIQALAEAEQQGERFTVRGFYRRHQGLGGYGTDRLRKLVEEAILDGKLQLEDGANTNGVGITFLNAHQQGCELTIIRKVGQSHPDNCHDL